MTNNLTRFSKKTWVYKQYLTIIVLFGAHKFAHICTDTTLGWCQNEGHVMIQFWHFTNIFVYVCILHIYSYILFPTLLAQKYTICGTSFMSHKLFTCTLCAICNIQYHFAADCSHAFNTSLYVWSFNIVRAYIVTSSDSWIHDGLWLRITVSQCLKLLSLTTSARTLTLLTNEAPRKWME